MGLPDSSDVEGGEIEKPQHKVNLKSFYILKTPVTQVLWMAVMDSNPSFHNQCFTCPVEKVSWYDALEFINRLNTMTGKHYRLPTEAEFEYAASGGNKTHGYEYAGSNNVNDVAWYNRLSSQPVALKKPNELGLYDMSGDIWEWCSDWFEDHYYNHSPIDSPQGPLKGEKKSLRGGTWVSLDEGCMVISRAGANPSHSDKYIGFRIVRDTL